MIGNAGMHIIFQNVIKLVTVSNINLSEKGEVLDVYRNQPY